MASSKTYYYWTHFAVALIVHCSFAMSTELSDLPQLEIPGIHVLNDSACGGSRKWGKWGSCVIVSEHCAKSGTIIVVHNAL